MKIPPVRAELLNGYGRADGRTDGRKHQPLILQDLFLVLFEQARNLYLKILHTMMVRRW